MSLGSWNFDLVIGQDVVTAYLANEGLDQRFRVFRNARAARQDSGVDLRSGLGRHRLEGLVKEKRSCRSTI